MMQFLPILGAVSLITGASAAPARQRRGNFQQIQPEHVIQPIAAPPAHVVQPVQLPPPNVNHLRPPPVHEQLLPPVRNVHEQVIPPLNLHPTSTLRAIELAHPTTVLRPIVTAHETTSSVHVINTVRPAAVPEHVIPPPNLVHPPPIEQQLSSFAHPTTTLNLLPAHETTIVRPQEIVHPTTTAAHVLPTFGSGSNNLGGGYDDCVQQCLARFPPPPSLVHTPPVNNVVQGNGNVHVVMVAPEGAGLKYFPFALNATIGDTIRYVWSTPANHTATLSSSLAICNRSAEAEARNFVSGVRSAAIEPQVFDVVVQTEEPQFFYCSVQQHCERGMWGIINPSSSFAGQNTVGSKFDEWVSGNPDLLAAWNFVSQNVAGTSAENWGANINLDGIPESAYSQVAANIMFTRANFAANPGMLETDLGATTPDGSPVAIVSDLNTLLSNANADPNAAFNAPNGVLTGAAPEPSDLINVVNSTSAASRSSMSAGVVVLVAMVGYMLF